MELRRSQRIAAEKANMAFQPVKKDSVSTRRILYEMREFDDPEFKRMFGYMHHVDDHTIALMDNDGVKWVVDRNKNFMEPPLVYCNGKAIPKRKYEWYPALTSLRWLLMLMTQRGLVSRDGQK